MLLTAVMASAAEYAEHSVLRSGTWAKISVPSTGIYRLTNAVIRQAGFTDMSKVRIYGYGGNLVPETLTSEWLNAHDDLQEVPTCTVNGEKFFYARGPVSWESATTLTRTRNVYSDYGYYFITEGDGEGATCSVESLKNAVLESHDAHHFLYENDEYAWSQTGRKLCDGTAIVAGRSATYNILVPEENNSLSANVIVSSGTASAYTVSSLNKTESQTTSSGTYVVASYKTTKLDYTEEELKTCSNDGKGHIVVPVTIECTSGTVRLDYISAVFSLTDTVANLDGSFPAADYVYRITNQDHHADGAVDYVIIIPTSQNWLSQAKRLGELHKKYDGMTYRIVPADELYNEFSSGTPDVSAYRRYLKMYYDKDRSTMPKAVLLFGGCLWDNRLNTTTAYAADDLLLIYETEASERTTSSFGCDDFITILADGSTMPINTEMRKADDPAFNVAVGRIAVTNSVDADAVVAKIEHYMTTPASGKWVDNIVFIGDDDKEQTGGTRHQIRINENADNVIAREQGFEVKKILLDAYERETESTGNSYPTAKKQIDDNVNSGALIVNYGGHAGATQLSEEKVVTATSCKAYRGSNYSVWFTAACETMPFDQTAESVGTNAMLNSEGGAVAFVGTLRTVTATQNEYLDKYFMQRVLDVDANGMPNSVGEALRQAKNNLLTNVGNEGYGNDLSSNKHQYSLFGDPAMRLAIPRYKVVVDSIAGESADDVVTAKGHSVITVKGHIESHDGTKKDAFSGVATAVVRDANETITTRGNIDESLKITYKDRLNTIYKGTASVSDGSFALTFMVPGDLVENEALGQIIVYATNNADTAALGECNNIYFHDVVEVKDKGLGPDIFAYIGSSSFVNGGTVGKTPCFFAELYDDEGIDVLGNSVGHNLELVVDGENTRTYNLNDQFTFDADSYQKGTVYYVIPELSDGAHSLRFRAWDLLGNMSSVSLNFTVESSMQPTIGDVWVSPNPVRGNATFHLITDFQGSEAQIYIDFFDPAGRKVRTVEYDQTLQVGGSGTSLSWNPAGMSPGLYLYRVRVSCDGIGYSSKTKKLIVAQ